MIYLLLLIPIALISGVFYRLGGASPSDFKKLPKWLVKGVTRDIGCSICSILEMLIIIKVLNVQYSWWQMLGYIAVGFWGLKSYWSWLNDILCKIAIKRVLKKGDASLVYVQDQIDHIIEYYENKQWFNWLLVGLTMSARWLFFFPWAWHYVIINGVVIMIWRVICNDVDWEEGGTGILFII